MKQIEYEHTGYEWKCRFVECDEEDPIGLGPTKEIARDQLMTQYIDNLLDIEPHKRSHDEEESIASWDREIRDYWESRK